MIKSSKTAFVFPGQGSQSIGMLADVSTNHLLVASCFETISQRLGYDVWDLIQAGPADKLNQTEYTQVAMLAADVAIYKVLQSLGAPQGMLLAGHSLGEYAALVCAEALTLEDAAALVAKRGQLMQETVPMGQGAMAAIVGLSDEVVSELCKEASNTAEQVTPANYNAIGQVVVAGHTPAVERVIALAEKAEARLAKIIPVSVPCHCSLLKDAAFQFEEALKNTTFHVPKLPVINNVDVQLYVSVDQIRTTLKAQLYMPVRWVETIQYMKTNGVDLVIESGPGKVLTGLSKRIDKSLEAISASDAVSIAAVIERLHQNNVERMS